MHGEAGETESVLILSQYIYVHNLNHVTYNGYEKKKSLVNCCKIFKNVKKVLIINNSNSVLLGKITRNPLGQRGHIHLEYRDARELFEQYFYPFE